MRVSAVQLPFAYADTPQEFFDRVREPVERAVALTREPRDSAQIVLLPDYVGMMLLGALVPTASSSRSFEEVAQAGGYRSAGAMLYAVAPVLGDFYLHLFGSLAARLQVYLAPGTVVEREGDQLYNSAYLFGPDGKVVGSQRQTHRTRDEIAWGLLRGDTLRVFDIGTARVGLIIGQDVAYPEVARILALQGANVLLHPAAYGRWSPEHFLLDLWRDVQSNQVFGIQACLAGKGRSAVYAPVEMTPDKRGWLAQACEDAEEIVSSVLDFNALQQVVDDYPIFSFFNCDFYAREFPAVYRLDAQFAD